ncbi:MAG: hypothetical protein LBL05_05730, partial [Synergistaceae bacterium]|nr:hypothetical protein [Synergistaceae bacterium]
PFALFGRKIDAAAIYDFIGRESDGEADETERKILSMINNARISPYCEEYARHKKHEEGFSELVEFLRDRTPREQLAYTGAFLRPGLCVLPRAQAKSRAELVEIMRRMETPPLARSHIDDLARRFLIPRSLTELFDDASTYAEGARCLEYLLGRGLLMPISLSGTIGGDVSLTDYEKAALVHCLGHSPKTLETIDELIGELGEISRELPRAANATSALEEMRTRKITDADRGYIEQLSELFARRRGVKEQKRENIVIWGAAAFIVCAVARAALGITGYLSDGQWAGFGILVLFLASMLLVSALEAFDSERRDFERRRLLVEKDPYNQNPFRRGRMDSEIETWAETRWPRRGYHFYRIVGMLAVAYFYGMFSLLRPLLPALPVILRTLGLVFPVFGALFGAGISYSLYNFRMRRSLREIERACALLCAVMKGNDEEHI